MLKHLQLNQTKAALILFFLFMIQMVCYNYQTILTTYPRTIHAWRQADCLNFTLNYYNNRATFFEPRVNNISNYGDSKTASDFPLVQYTVAQIWKLFGKSITLFRLIDLGFLLLGLLYVFKLCYYWTKDYFISITTTVLLYTSPILAYYGPSFINEIQAFGLGCAGFYFTIKWLEEKKRKQFIAIVLLFLFAGLAKVSVFFVYAIALLLIGKNFLESFKTCNRQQKKKWFLNLFLLLVPIAVSLSWSAYAACYNSMHYNLFLVGIVPAWGIDKERKHLILTQLFDDTLPQMFNSALLVVIFVFVVAYLITHIKQFFSSTYLTVLSGFALFFSYILLFFQNLGVHDYYFIVLLMIVFILLCLGIKHINEIYPWVFKKSITRVAVVFLIILLTYQTTVKTRVRVDYTKESSWQCMILNKQKIELYQFLIWEDRARFAELENIAPNLEAMHVAKNDTVLVLGDLFSTRSLGIIDRVGYTGFNTLYEDVPKFIDARKKHGLKYLFVLDPELLKDEKLKPYLKNKLFLRNSTSIYKL